MAAWVCGRSFAGIAVSSSAEVQIVFSCECCVLSGRTDPSFSGNLPSTCEYVCVCVCVIGCDQVQQQTSTPTTRRQKIVAD